MPTAAGPCWQLGSPSPGHTETQAQTTVTWGHHQYPTSPLALHCHLCQGTHQGGRSQAFASWQLHSAASSQQHSRWAPEPRPKPSAPGPSIYHPARPLSTAGPSIGLSVGHFPSHWGALPRATPTDPQLLKETVAVPAPSSSPFPMKNVCAHDRHSLVGTATSRRAFPGCSFCPVQCPPKGLSRSPLPPGWSTSPGTQGAPKCGSAPSTTLLVLTFLHRDGWFLLPQPQEDEEEHQGDEDLKGQHPLGMTENRGNRMLRDRTQPVERSMGSTGASRHWCSAALFPHNADGWWLCHSSASSKQVPGHPTTSCLHHPVQSTAGRGRVHRRDGSLLQQCKQSAEVSVQPQWSSIAGVA